MILLTTLYFAMSFNPGSRHEPVLWTLLTKAQCQRMERETSGTWCQPIKIRRTK